MKTLLGRIAALGMAPLAATAIAMPASAEPGPASSPSRSSTMAWQCTPGSMCVYDDHNGVWINHGYEFPGGVNSGDCQYVDPMRSYFNTTGQHQIVWENQDCTGNHVVVSPGAQGNVPEFFYWGQVRSVGGL